MTTNTNSEIKNLFILIFIFTLRKKTTTKVFQIQHNAIKHKWKTKRQTNVKTNKQTKILQEKTKNVPTLLTVC